MRCGADTGRDVGQQFVRQGNETLADFFDQLLLEYREAVGSELASAAPAEMPHTLPIPWLADFVHRLCAPFSFKIEAAADEDVHAALTEKIADEVQAVQVYMGSWRSSGVMVGAPPENVEDITYKTLTANVYPWPTIGEHPTPERADGRLVKAFPLRFPMGVADLRQPRLRSDFHVVDAVQHLFRYFTGHFFNANDGHRVIWALFNTALREIAHEKGGLVHKNSKESILTKEDLQAMCATRRDLVHKLSTFGATIPTTSMHWKHEAHNLEWIVRQMSWRPPWCPREARDLLETNPKLGRGPLRFGDALSRAADAQPATVSGSMEAQCQRECEVVLDIADPVLAQDVASDSEASSAAKSSEGKLEPLNVDGFLAELGSADCGGGAPMNSAVPHPKEFWHQEPPRLVPDAYGYGRIPGFWFTLNLPFNYLFEIHRFQQAVQELVQGGEGA